MDGWPARRKAATYTGQHKHKKRGQTSVLRVGFEHTIPVFERAKIFYVLDRAATVIVILTFGVIYSEIQIASLNKE
jgi:hypothetical protein